MQTFHLGWIGLLLGLSVWTAANTDGRERRLTPTEIAAMPSTGPGAGTSGVGGIRTTVLSGDPTREGLYTIRLNVPANATIAAHRHRDDRVERDLALRVRLQVCFRKVQASRPYRRLAASRRGR